MVSFVVPIYYCDPTLYLPIVRCLSSITPYTYVGHDYVFIDDASPLSLPPEWPITWTSNTNQGFTKSVNLGLESAFAVDDVDIVIVMNDDIEMTPDCFDRFKEISGLQIASPADTASSPDDRFGACWGMTREVYELLGPLNEEYKHFFSDVDYYERALEAGVEIIKWKDIVLNHSESSTFKTLDKESLLNEDAKKYYKR